MGSVDSRSSSCSVECSVVERKVVHPGDRSNHETMLHTGIRNVWTVHAAKIPVRNGHGKNGWGYDCPSRRSFLLGGLHLVSLAVNLSWLRDSLPGESDQHDERRKEQQGDDWHQQVPPRHVSPRHIHERLDAAIAALNLVPVLIIFIAAYTRCLGGVFAF